MNPNKAEKLFIIMKKYGVTHLKTLELEINMGGGPALPSDELIVPEVKRDEKIPPPQAAPPVEIKIPHHMNEVASLLKLNDNDLVEKLFPDYSQVSQKAGE